MILDCLAIDSQVLIHYLGLGKYLQEIDPLQRPMLWQLQGIIIFCRVHFFRTITEAVGRNDRGIGVWSRMASLIDCKSEDDYVQLCELLIGKSSPSTFQALSSCLLTTQPMRIPKFRTGQCIKDSQLLKLGLISTAQISLDLSMIL